jgi:hypothetical protein
MNDEQVFVVCVLIYLTISLIYFFCSTLNLTITNGDPFELAGKLYKCESRAIKKPLTQTAWENSK